MTRLHDDRSQRMRGPRPDRVRVRRSHPRRVQIPARWPDLRRLARTAL